MNCEKCNAQLSIRSTCRIIKGVDGQVSYACISCPIEQDKLLLQKAYIDFCQALQKICENGVELANALNSAHDALKWAEKAV